MNYSVVSEEPSSQNLLPLAHSGGHLLEDHLKSVVQLAAEFSEQFDKNDLKKQWAYLARHYANCNKGYAH